MFWQAYRYILQNMDKKDSHIELLDRFFRGLTSPEEDVQLKSWIKQPDFQQKFSAYYQQCWALAPDTMDKAVQNEMFTELLSQIDASSTTETKVLKTRNRFLRQIGRYAAVACIILAVGSGAYYAGVKRPADDANTEVTMSVSNGQKADIILADGTKVYINSDSRIVYDNTYNKKTRMVSLEGEAYFEVTKNRHKPFTVQRDPMRVRVLGTTFNFKSDKSCRVAEATLIEGEIEVKGNREEGQIILTPGQRAELNKNNGRLTVKQVDAKLDAVWHDNLIPFQKADIFTIAKALERFYDVKIILSPDIQANRTYSGVLRKKSNIESVLKSLQNSIPIDYKIVGNNIFISPK